MSSVKRSFTAIGLAALVLLTQGCATMIAAAISGGDRDAVRTGLRVDATIGAGLVASALSNRSQPSEQPTIVAVPQVGAAST